jgi:hypothetical protein
VRIRHNCCFRETGRTPGSPRHCSGTNSRVAEIRQPRDRPAGPDGTLRGASGLYSDETCSDPADDLAWCLCGHYGRRSSDQAGAAGFRVLRAPRRRSKKVRDSERAAPQAHRAQETTTAAEAAGSGKARRVAFRQTLKGSGQDKQHWKRPLRRRLFSLASSTEKFFVSRHPQLLCP